MGSREQAAVQLPVAVMVPAAACVLLLTLAALGASGQGQISLGKPLLPPRVASTPSHTGGPTRPGVARLLGARGLFTGTCRTEKAGSRADVQAMRASRVPAEAP